MNNNLNLPPAELIQKSDHFYTALETFSRQPILAVDTEANSLYAYQEQVCLIQISSPDQDYIVDPLSLPDISPLGEILADPGIEKVLHASEYDVKILWDDFQFQLENLFDTMIAARMLGRKKLGLDSLLEEKFGITVNKRFQRADWSRRPLPADMLRYAQLDTHFLIEIRNWLAGELKQAGRWEIAQEDFRRAAQAYQRPERDRLPSCWRQQGARDLSPQQGAVLKELNAYRDQIARERDLPLFKVLGNKTLLALAEETPTTREELRRANIPHKKQAERLGEGLLQAVRGGLEAPPFRPPRRPRPDDAYLARERALKDWRKAKAREAGLNSAVILPRYLLEELARENPRTREELAEILEEEVPLRYAHYGGELLQVLSRA